MAQTKHALIVDTDQDWAAELTSLLEGLGFEVTTLQDPSEAAETLRGEDYAVALVNVTLPDMSWRNTVRSIKEAARDTIVMMMKRSPEEDEVRRALSSGTYVAISSPVSEEQFTNLIASKKDGMLVTLRSGAGP